MLTLLVSKDRCHIYLYVTILFLFLLCLIIKNSNESLTFDVMAHPQMGIYFLPQSKTSCSGFNQTQEFKAS